MAKKKTAPKAKLKPKLLKLPTDWINRIDQQRGELSFSDFVREAILDKVGRAGLSEMPGWGKGRWKSDTPTSGRRADRPPT